MPVPEFQSFMLPVLQLASDNELQSLPEARDVLASKFGLTEQDLGEMLPSGRQRRFNNRVAWAKVYLEQAGLVESPKRGTFRITALGQTLLAERPS